MGKQRFQITEDDQAELRRAYREARDADTRTRYQAVWLYVEGYPVVEISQITGCHRSSLMEWCQKYREGGIGGLEDHRGGPQRAKLNEEQMKAMRELLHEYTPHNLLGFETHTVSGQYWTVEDVAQVVEKRYGVRWESRTSYQRLLATCGFSYQRSEKVYKSRQERAVMEFEALVEKNSWTLPRMHPIP